MFATARLPATPRAIALALTVAFFGVFGSSNPSAAVTVSFGTTAGSFTPYVEGDFTFDTAQLVNGICSAGACLSLNDNQTATLTKVGGGTFTLSSFWYELLGGGTPNQLTIESFSGATLLSTVTSSVTNNIAQLFLTPFTDVTSIVFSTVGGGNVHIDDLALLIGPVGAPFAAPLPAALPLFASGLGALGFLGWRRRRKHSATPAAAA